MSTTVNNNDASSSSTSNNGESFDLRMKSMEDQINNLSLAFTRFMKEPIDDESSNNVDVPTDYQLSDTLLGQYKHMVNNQGLLVEEECILKKDEISELNKVFNFPSNFQVNVAPFGTPDSSSPVLRMLRDLNVSVIAYLDDLLIVGSTKEECLSNLKKKMDLLVKLGFKLNQEKSVLEPTQSITFLGLQIDSVSMKLLVPKEKKKSVIKEIRNFLKLDCCSPRKLAGLKGKLIALKDAVIPFRLYTHVKSEISHWLTVLNQCNGKEIDLFPSYDYVLTTDASESGAGATLKKGNKIIKTW
ncbi:hypothetical protein ACTFIW_012066 [Dictyostelium discoideum]